MSIIRKGTWTLHYTIGSVVTGPVRKGDEVEDFRGDKATITDGRPPHKPGSAGFVYPAEGGEFYPSVFGLKWVDDCQSCG